MFGCEPSFENVLCLEMKYYYTFPSSSFFLFPFFKIEKNKSYLLPEKLYIEGAAQNNIEILLSTSTEFSGPGYPAQNSCAKKDFVSTPSRAALRELLPARSRLHIEPNVGEVTAVIASHHFEAVLELRELVDPVPGRCWRVLQCLRHVHVLEFVRLCVRADVVEIEVRYLRHHGCHVLLLELHRLVPGRSVRGEQANLTGLVLGWIEAKCCKKTCVGICVGKLSPRSTQCTPLHSSKITFLFQKIARILSFEKI